MTRDLIVNLSLVISFLTITGHLFKDKPIRSSLHHKIIGGIIAGFLGTLLMFFSIQITETTIMDFRNFAIIVSTLYGGFTSSIVTIMMLSFSRIAFFDFNNSSITAVFTFIILVILCWIILKLKQKDLYKFLYMNIVNIIIVWAAFAYLIEDKRKLFDVSIYYGMISLLGGFIIFYIADYIVKTNNYYRKLKNSAEKDFLTGLNNVRQFDLLWNRLLKEAHDYKQPLSILLIDIDYFKKINDTHGHIAGDTVLKELSTILKNTTRPIDVVSRNGGEEFSIILPRCTNKQAIEVAENIRSTIKIHPFIILNTIKINITVSIGVATYLETIHNTHDIIDQADDFLYAAKHSGRDQVRSLKC